MPLDDAQFQAALNQEQKDFLASVLKKTADDAAVKAKADEAEARKKAVPEKYEIKFGEKSALDPKEDAEKITAYAKAQGYSNEQAQALVAQMEERAQGVLTRQQAWFEQEKENWKKETESDKEIGGDKLPDTLANTKRVMDRFAPEGSVIRKLLNESGYGNHPEFVRFVNSIGKLMREDKGFGGSGGGGGGSGKDPAKKLYPNLK